MPQQSWGDVVELNSTYRLVSTMCIVKELLNSIYFYRHYRNNNSGTILWPIVYVKSYSVHIKQTRLKQCLPGRPTRKMFSVVAERELSLMATIISFTGCYVTEYYNACVVGSTLRHLILNDKREHRRNMDFSYRKVYPYLKNHQNRAISFQSSPAHTEKWRKIHKIMQNIENATTSISPLKPTI